jgi:hypothetical protein
MENWRKFLTEQPQMDMITGPGGESPDTDDYYQKYKDSLRPRFRENLERMEDGCREQGPESGYCEQVRRAKALAREYQKRRETPYKEPGAIKTAQTIMKMMVLILDPTGQVGDIDLNTGKITPQHKILKQEFDNFKENPSLLGAGSVALASLGMIPVIGKLSKLGKLAKGANASTQLKRKKTILQNASNISKEMKKSGDPNLIAKSKEIDNAIERVTLPKRRRSGSYIRGVQKQINDRFFKLVRSGRLKVGETKNYKVPGGSTLELHAIEIKIVPMKVNPNSPPTRKVTSSGTYGSDRLGTGTGKGGDIEIELAINPRFINKDGTIRKEAYGELHKELNKTGFHEMVHSRQATRQRKGSRAAEDRAMTADVPDNYMSYRLSPEEVSAHARDAARGTNIRKVSKLGIDTVDLMAQRISPKYRTFEDLVKARNPNHYEVIKNQVAYLQKHIPCAAISAANVIDLESLGIFNTDGLSPRNQKIIDTDSKKNAIVINPKNCSKKLVENYIKKIILEELQHVIESEIIH